MLPEENGKARYFRKELDKKGRTIPIEYPEYFNRDGWCWPGFYLAPFWALKKGLIINGVVYTAIFFTLFTLIDGYIANHSEYQEWIYYCLVFGFLHLVNGVHCGLSGYRTYCGFLDRFNVQAIMLIKIISAIFLGLLLLIGIPVAFMIWLAIELMID